MATAALAAILLAPVMTGLVRGLRSIWLADDQGPAWGHISHPANLAVLRVAVFSALAAKGVGSPAVLFASLPDVFLAPPPGWGWLPGSLLPGPRLTALAQWLLVAFAGLATLGVRTRWSGSLAALLAVYVLGVPQLYGKVDHYHHLIWLSALLAVSPSGDALSIDRIRDNRRAGRPLLDSPAPSVDYGLPLQLTWALMGIAYFFPGFHKAVLTGAEWFSGDLLRSHLWAKWFEIDWRPTLRIDRYPLLLQWTSGAVVIFELSFLFLVFSRKTRWLAALSGLAFHNATTVFMRIPFWSLQICYVGLVDWARLWSRIRQKAMRAPTGSSGRWRTAGWLGGTLVAVNVLCGLANLHSWPFSAYPTFAFAEPMAKPVVQVETFQDGIVASADRFGRGGAWGLSPERFGRLVLRLVADPTHDRVRNFWRVHQRLDPEGTPTPDSVRFSVLQLSIDPEQPDGPVAEPIHMRTICPEEPDSRCPRRP